MTKQATLGPIDPSVITALNPGVPGAPDQRAPVSVEAIRGYTELAKQEYSLKGASLKDVLLKLAEHVHPLVLGEAYRSRSQIKMLANNLLKHQVSDKRVKQKIIDFLCSESGSHDYTINRREAKDSLGLEVEKPTAELYETMKAIYKDFRQELMLQTPVQPAALLGTQNSVQYSYPRVLVESVLGGSDVYNNEGIYTKLVTQDPAGATQIAIQDMRTFEGWRHNVP